jgi:tripeptide aminopeptidase
MQTMEADRKWFEDDVLERFVRYAKVYTTSDSHNESTPSTERQWDLARMLVDELKAMGIEEVTLTGHCNVVARIPAVGGSSAAPVLFLAHLDTAPDFSGENVNPRIHRDYDGGVIDLDGEHVLDPESNPLLKNYVGDTIITTDGSTLLGADDKAGVAEIMTAARYLMEHPDIPRGEVEIVFTPDEEIGRGTEKFPRDLIRSAFGFTLDGDEEGSYNAQCFNAWSVEVDFTGVMIHPGYARGELANAITMAATYVSMLPRNETPEATDGDYGFYAAKEISGNMEKAKLGIFIRDFDRDQIDRRLAYLENLAKTVELQFPGSKVEFRSKQMYLNLKPFLDETPEILETLEAAIRDTGMEPVQKSIRGGTDGARLTEMGLPTPNIFAGGMNFHSRYEWVALRAMVRAAKVVLNIISRRAG